jgi:hypothetical protein
VWSSRTTFRFSRMNLPDAAFYSKPFSSFSIGAILRANHCEGIRKRSQCWWGCGAVRRSTFIHFTVCLTTAPQHFPKHVLNTVRSSASSLNLHYPFVSGLISSSCVCRLHRLPVSSKIYSLWESVHSLLLTFTLASCASYLKGIAGSKSLEIGLRFYCPDSLSDGRLNFDMANCLHRSQSYCCSSHIPLFYAFGIVTSTGSRY